MRIAILFLALIAILTALLIFHVSGAKKQVLFIYKFIFAADSMVTLATITVFYNSKIQADLQLGVTKQAFTISIICIIASIVLLAYQYWKQRPTLNLKMLMAASFPLFAYNFSVSFFTGRLLYFFINHR